jgi:hypothetical protein
MCGHYLSNLSEILGYYGMKWLDFMEEHHRKLFREMKKNKTLYAVAKSVNETAREYKALLDRHLDIIKRTYTKSTINTTFPCKDIKSSATNHFCRAFCFSSSSVRIFTLKLAFHIRVYGFYEGGWGYR